MCNTAGTDRSRVNLFEISRDRAGWKDLFGILRSVEQQEISCEFVKLHDNLLGMAYRLFYAGMSGA